MVDVYIEPFPETIAARDLFLAVRALTARRLRGRLITVIRDGSENGGRLLIAGDGTVTGALTGPAAAIRCDPARWTPVRKPCLAALEEGRENRDECRTIGRTSNGRVRPAPRSVSSLRGSAASADLHFFSELHGPHRPGAPDAGHREGTGSFPQRGGCAFFNRIRRLFRYLALVGFRLRALEPSPDDGAVSMLLRAALLATAHSEMCGAPHRGFSVGLARVSTFLPPSPP